MQAKALFLILLLWGSEAARIERGSAATRAIAKVRGVEDDWDSENMKCRWGYRKWGCKPVDKTVLPKGSCEYRFLPRDWKISQSCRLSDAYMLSNDRGKYFKLQAGLLAAKARKFKDGCKSVSLFNLNSKLLCQRRSMHLMRSMEFMAKAQGKELTSSLSDAEKDEQKLIYAEALGHISDAIGEEGSYVLKLQKKMKNDLAGVRADPKGSVTKIIALLEKLLRGSDEEQREAREEIDAMPSSTSAATGALKEAQDANLERLARGLEDEEASAAELIDVTNPLELSEDEMQEMQLHSTDEDQHERDDGLSDSEGDLPGHSSLLQRALASSGGDGGRVVAFIGFAVIVALVVLAVMTTVMWVLGAIVTWAFISIFGCGAYHVGQNDKASEVEKNGGQVERHGVGATLKCMVKWIAAPFIFIGSAARAVWRFFQDDKPKKTEKTEGSHLQLGGRAAIRLLPAPANEEQCSSNITSGEGTTAGMEAEMGSKVPRT